MSGSEHPHGTLIRDVKNDLNRLGCSVFCLAPTACFACRSLVVGSFGVGVGI